MQLIWGSSLICLMHLFALCRMSYSELRDRDSMIGMKEESDTPGTGLNFLVLGDWGGLPYSPYRTDVEKAVSKAMGTVAENINAQFIVALGDNFYWDGVKDEYDARFKETFEDVFTAQSLQVPWYVVAGNHDHHRNVSAQIDYSQKSERWNFPNYYYSKIFNVPGITGQNQVKLGTLMKQDERNSKISNILLPWQHSRFGSLKVKLQQFFGDGICFAGSNRTLQLILIDTVQLCGNTGHDFYPKKPEGPEEIHVARKQWDWLESTLKESTADYLLVGGHYPVWSISSHGPTECLVDQLQPMLPKYQATSYICGHDHNLQHLTEANSTVGYFVIGCANFINPKRTHEEDIPDDVSLKFFWADYSKYGGFAKVQVTEDHLTMVFVNSEQEEIHSAVLMPRRKV